VLLSSRPRHRSPSVVFAGNYAAHRHSRRLGRLEKAMDFSKVSSFHPCKHFKQRVAGSNPARLTSNRPRRLARPRTPAFHADNTGSNPVGDAKLFLWLETYGPKTVRSSKVVCRSNSPQPSPWTSRNVPYFAQQPPTFLELQLVSSAKAKTIGSSQKALGIGYR
jgi:hypothetical protein